MCGVALSDAGITCAGRHTETLTFGVTVEDPPVPATGLSLNKTSAEFWTIMSEGSLTDTLEVTPVPENTTDELEYTWESSDPDVATVDQNGNITAKSSGRAVITVRAGELSAACTVYVNTFLTPNKRLTSVTYPVPGSDADHPVYFKGDGFMTEPTSTTTGSVVYSHSVDKSFDDLYFNDVKILRTSNGKLFEGVYITGGTGTQDDPYILKKSDVTTYAY